MLHYTQNRSGCYCELTIDLFTKSKRNKRKFTENCIKIRKSTPDRGQLAELCTTDFGIMNSSALKMHMEDLKASKHKGLFVAEMVRHNNQTALLTDKWSQFSKAIPSVRNGKK